MAGQRRRRKMNPDTTRVFTSRSAGHLAVTSLWRQAQMKRRVRGQASEDMKMDSVMSSSTWRRNSALAQASVGLSILLGLSSQLSFVSRILWMVGKRAVWRKSWQTLLM